MYNLTSIAAVVAAVGVCGLAGALWRVAVALERAGRSIAAGLARADTAAAETAYRLGKHRHRLDVGDTGEILRIVR
jgi:hypothetical protein